MNESIDIIKHYKIVPIVNVRRNEDALPTLGAILCAGLPVAQISVKSECAFAAIKSGAITFPDMAIGAGSVLTAAQAELAINSGARFVVSPGFSSAIADMCAEARVVYIPGCITPTDIMTAVENKLNFVSIFPSVDSARIGYLSDIAGEFAGVDLMPQGNLDAAQVKSLLGIHGVSACASSSIMSSDFDEIAKNCVQMLDFLGV